MFTVLALSCAMTVSAQTNETSGRSGQSAPHIVLPVDTLIVPIPDAVFVSDEDGMAKDNVIADDQIVTGNLGVGYDCVDGEAFGFTTILMKENNCQLKFDDTSLTAGFPANDWAIIANDASSGGLNYLAIQDATASVIPFRVMAGAPLDAMNIGSTGNIGLGTSSSIMRIHMKKGDTPGIRFEQDTTSGWTAQTWDIAGNEANFFIRDVTNGSSLPFRIQPGAPTNSLSIKATGNVGIGTFNPSDKLEINGSMRLTPLAVVPPVPGVGSIYMDSTEQVIKYFNGVQWNTISPDTDEQNLTAATLTGSILQIDIENGTSVSVDLAPLLADLEARVTALEAALGMKEGKTEKAGILQNNPNPYTTQTTIQYFIPYDVQNASLAIYNVKGVKIKDILLSGRGEGSIKISKDDLESGSYFYSLILDGQKSDSKIMIKVE